MTTVDLKGFFDMLEHVKNQPFSRRKKFFDCIEQRIHKRMNKNNRSIYPWSPAWPSALTLLKPKDLKHAIKAMHERE